MSYRASSPTSQNWNGNWSYQNDSPSYPESKNSSNATSPIEESAKKEKKTKEKKEKNTWNDKWGDDELWESLNK